MGNILEQLHDALGDDLERIKRRFKPGAKVTLVVRQPELPGDTGVVIGDDDLDAAIAEIQKQRKTGTVTGGTECTNNTPGWFAGHWRDWHRGHGCDKDDGKPRTPEAASEIHQRALRNGMPPSGRKA